MWRLYRRIIRAMPAEAYEIDPVCDPRWGALVSNHPRASVFHSVPWLKSLQRTYGYSPIAFTTAPPHNPLRNALLFCAVNSWLTGRRLVSLPFSDHCEPLCDSNEELDLLSRYLLSIRAHRGWEYIEMRPVSSRFSEIRGVFSPTRKFQLHTIDLRPDSDALFRGFDKDSVQRRIRRAERACLIEKCGTSDELLRAFYRLFVITRRRHGLPPIPRNWFTNLIQEHGNTLAIRVAYKDRQPVAAILTLQLRDVVYYKYGCSDHKFNRLGATPWLFWNAIVAAKLKGAVQFDLGRTDQGQAGLLAFKNHWVSSPQELVYWGFPGAPAVGPAHGWKMKAAKRIFSFAPESVLVLTGRLLYRHIG